MITREDDLIKRAAYGDQEAFRQLWENHRLLLFSIIPFACIALVLLRFAGFTLPILLIAIGLCVILSIGAIFLLDRQRRAMAARADNLMVQWLGRGRACRGYMLWRAGIERHLAEG